jgi:hypothetical protein
LTVHAPPSRTSPAITREEARRNEKSVVEKGDIGCCRGRGMLEGRRRDSSLLLEIHVYLCRSRGLPRGRQPRYDLTIFRSSKLS